MIGASLRFAREKAGMTQEDLALKTGIDRAYISLVENDRNTPTVNKFVALCRGIGVRAWSVLKRAEEGK